MNSEEVWVLCHHLEEHAELGKISWTTDSPPHRLSLDQKPLASRHEASEPVPQNLEFSFSIIFEVNF